MTFIPAVVYTDPKAALEWLNKAFDFELTMLIEGPDGDARMMHSEMSFQGKGRIMVSGEWPEWAKSPRSIDGANTQRVEVLVDDGIDAHCEQARAAGAVILQEPEDQFYGQRTYRAADPEGHMWTFAQRVRSVTREEAEAATGLKIQGWA